VLEAKARLDHPAVPRENTRVVRDEERPARARNVLEPRRRDAPPDAVQKLEQRPPGPRGRLVEAEVVEVQRPGPVLEQVPEVDEPRAAT